MKTGDVFRHIKTGNLYMILHNAISADNATHGEPTVVYKRPDVAAVYTRNLAEFNNKFSRAYGNDKKLNRSTGNESVGG